MDERLVKLSEKWQWLIEIAKEMQYGEAKVGFFNGEPVSVEQPMRSRNYSAETRK